MKRCWSFLILGWMALLPVAGWAQMGIPQDSLLWLKADSGIIKDADSKISSWQDQSGHYNDATQGNADLQPLGLSDATTNNPVVRFDGSGDFLELPGNFNDFSNGLTFIVVTKPTSNSWCPRWITLGNGPGADEIALMRNGDGNDLSYVSDVNGTVAASAITNDVYQIFEVVHETSGKVTIYKNGVQVTTQSVPLPATVSRILNYIGKSLWDGDAFFQGDISEILIYQRALTTEERSATEIVLENRYGILPVPSFSVRTGAYSHALNVSLATNFPGGQIHYTLDGSEPGNTSPLYTSPIPVTSTLQIKAVVVNDAGSISPVVSAEYRLYDGRAGKIVWEYWQGYNIDSWLAATNVGQTTDWNLLSSFEGPQNIDDNYVARYRGYIIPPTSGYYTFYLSSDDGSRLYLSTNFDPANKQLIAQPGYSGFEDWDNAAKSTSIYLSGGQHYYVEVLHEEGGGDDHCEVGWKLADGSLERPIPGTRLEAYSEDDLTTVLFPPSISLNGGLYSTARTVTLSSNLVGAEIHYTTDGTEPDENSPIYNGTLTFSVTTILKVKAYKSGQPASDTVTAVYTIDTSIVIPAEGLDLWLKADLASSITQDSSGRVSAWKNACDGLPLYSALQSDTTSQPIYTGSAINGQPALKFDGYLQYIATDPSLYVGNPSTIFVVYQSLTDPNNTDYNYNGFWGVRTYPVESITYPFQWRMGQSGSNNFQQLISSGYVGVSTSTTSSLSGQTFINEAMADHDENGGSVSRYFVNASEYTVNHNRYTDAGQLSLGGVEGNFDTGDGGFHEHISNNCYIAEVIVYHQALSDADRQKVEKYLGAKYGVSLKAPAPQIALDANGKVTLSSGLANAPIYYTKTGDEPTTRSSVYTSPFTLSAGATVKAKTILTGYADSDTVTVRYESTASIPLTGLKLWLKGDTGLVKDSAGRVNRWIDLSGNGNDAVQIDDGRRPVYQEGVMAYNSALLFDGSANFLLTPLTTTDNTTTFVVFQPKSSSSGPAVATEQGYVLGQSENRMLFQSAWNSEVGSQSFDTDPTALVGKNFMAEGILQVLSTGEVGTDFFGQFKLNQTAFTQLVVGQQGGGVIALGAQLQNSNPDDLRWTNYLDGTVFSNSLIAEVLVYDAQLSDSDRETIENYLMQKYGVVASDPVASPSGGTFKTTQTVTLTNIPTSATAYYTLNGNDPTTSSTAYSESIPVSTTATLKVRYFFPNGTSSGISSFAFVIDPNLPITTDGMALWLKGDAGVSVDDLGLVSRWLDQSGHGMSAFQSGTASQPVYQASGVNGQPSVAFNGSAAYLQCPSGFADFTQGITVIVVAKPTAAGNQARFIDWGNGAGSDNIFFYRKETSSQMRFALFSGSQTFAAMNSSDSGEDLQQGVYQVLVTDYDGVGQIDFYRNATALAHGLSDGSGGTIPNVRRTRNYIGKSNWDEDALYQGDMAEILVYNRKLTDTERQAIDLYLSAKYGIPLPAPDLGTTGGLFKSAQQVTLSVPANATAYYTLDGTEPTASSTAYSGPITIGSSSTLKVKYIYANGAESGATTVSYVIDPNLPIAEGSVLLWLKADAGVTTNSSGLVSQWKDQSGHGNDASQANASSQPTWVASGLNGMPVMQFDGTGDFLQMPSGFDDFTSGVTILIVTNPTSVAQWERFLTFGNGPNNKGIALCRSSTSNDLAFNSVAAGGAIELNKNQLFTITQAQDGTTHIYKNGLLLGDGTQSLPENGTRTLNYIGKSQWDADALFKGTIAEIIVYNRALTDAERNQTESYLYDRYQLLPKVNPPAISPAGGFYENSVTVTLSDPMVGTVLHYTTDNTDPTEQSAIYAGPLTFTQSAVVKVRGYVNGYQPSDIVSASYQVGVAPGNGDGLAATYFSQQDLQGTSIKRIDPVLNFDWAYGSPDSRIPSDHFSSRWEGKLVPRFTETYTIGAFANNGVRVWINGQLLFEDWSLDFVYWHQATITLVRGQEYDIKVEYFENDDYAEAHLYWSSPSTPQEIIPQTQLYSKITDGFTATPQTDPAPGTFSKAVTVALASATANGEIHYTLDGTTPDSNSPVYAGPFQISSTTTLKAFTSAAGMTTGGTLVATYTIDTSGPVLSNSQYGGGTFTNGLTITQSGLISVAASDANGLSRVEFYLDGTLIATDTKGSDGYSALLNILTLTDGQHTVLIKAYDAVGNVTQQTLTFNEMLPVPPAPTISSPASGSTANSSVTIAGTAEAGSQITLYRNNQSLGVVTVAGTNGSFSASVSLLDGSNAIQVSARNRSGEGGKSNTVTLDRDGTVPTAPGALQASSQAGGAIQLSWTASAKTSIKGYNVYRSTEAFTDSSSATKITNSPVSGLVYTDQTPTDTAYYYRVTAVSLAGVESSLSNQAQAISDRVLPSASITYTPLGLYDSTLGRFGVGQVNVTVSMSEKLVATPFLSIKPASGQLISVPLSVDPSDPQKYVGSFIIDSITPAGAAVAILSSRDAVGNRGATITQGQGLLIDTAGPDVTDLSILPSQSIKNDATNPVAVSFVARLSSIVKPDTTPQFKYSLSRTTPAPLLIADVTPVLGDSQSYAFTVQLPAQAGTTQPETLTIYSSAEDDLGNVSTTIIPVHAFQVYQGALPGIDPPAGLAAKSLSVGQVQLTWQAAPTAADYQIYRRVQNGTAQPIQRSTGLLTYTDTPDSDGTYFYSVASIRHENGEESIGTPSGEVQAVSDRTAPNPPQDLALVVAGNGIRLSWGASTSNESVAYRVYRATAPINSAAGLTPLADGVSLLSTVDAVPRYDQPYYAVAALDKAGNMSALVSGSCSAPILPPTNIIVTTTDGGSPQLVWSAAGGQPQSGALAGFNLYLGADDQKTKLNAALLSTGAYVDTGYLSDERRYTVVSVSNLDAESIGHSVVLPKLEFALQSGSAVKRGLMNHLTYRIKNPGTQTLSNAQVHAQVGGIDHISSVFAVAPNTEVTQSVVVGGYSSLPDSAPVVSTLELDSNAGETVRFVRNDSVSVSNGQLTVLLTGANFTRGGTATVGFTLSNPGSEPVEVRTASINGAAASPDMRLIVLDADGNTLATQGVTIASGGTVFNLSNGDSVLRVGAGEEVDSPNIAIAIPSNASDRIYLALEIDHVYYHLGQADQVTMDGIKTRSQFAVVDTSYYGLVEAVTPQESLGDQAITITGHAYNRTGNTVAPKVSLNVKVINQGFERTIPVVTDATGSFTAVFKPLSGENGGVYNVCAVHPDLLDRTAQQTFTIKKLVVSPMSGDLRMPKNYVMPLSWDVTAGAGTGASQLRVEVVAEDQANGQLPPGVTFTPGTAADRIVSGQTVSVTASMQANNNILTNSGTLVVRLRSSDDNGTPWAKMRINYAFANAEPALRWSSNTVLTGVSPSQSVTENVTLTNVGLTAAEDVVVKLLNSNGTAAPGWISASIPAQVGQVAVGAEVPVSLTFAPDANVAEGDYLFILRANGSNHANVDVNVSVTLSASGQGQVLFHVNDQFTGSGAGKNELGVVGAQITLQNERVPTISLSSPLVTADDGTAMSPALPSGLYKYKVTADNHDSMTGRIWIRSGTTITQEVNLSFNFVTVDWEVTPTTIQDRYDLTLSLTFDTQVLAPLIIITPGAINLPAMQKGEVYNGELEITNQGLIAAKNAHLDTPTSSDYFDYQLLAPVPTSLAAGESIKVPFRLICKKSLPGATTTAAAVGVGAMPFLAMGLFCFRRRRAASAFIVAFMAGTILISPLMQEKARAESDCAKLIEMLIFGYTYDCKSGPYPGKSSCTLSYYFGSCAGSFFGWLWGSGWWNASASSGDSSSNSNTEGDASADTCPGKPNGPDPDSPPDCDKCDENSQQKSWINLVWREYQDSIDELSLPVAGGSQVALTREYVGYKWLWRDEQTLEIQTGSDGLIYKIVKDRANYTPLDSAKTVFGNFSSRIYVKTGGYRWEARMGDWKEYDSQGKLIARGNRNLTLAKILYDTQGRVSGITDVNDQQLFWYEYDGTSLYKKAVRDRAGRRVEYGWTNGNLTSVKDVLGLSTTYTYDDQGRITSKTDVDGHVYSIGYENNAAITFTDSQSGASTHYAYTYDKNKKQYYIKLTKPSGEITEKIFDNKEQMISNSVGGDLGQSVSRGGRTNTITDGAGNVTVRTYNESNDLIKEVAPDGGTTSYEYGAYHQPTKVTAANGVTVAATYDENGNLLTQTEDAGGLNQRTTTYTYTAYNQIESKTDPRGRKIRYEYNSVGQLLREYDNADSTRQTTYTYDDRGFRQTKIDALGRITRYEYDDSGRLTKDTNPLGESTVYTFEGSLLKQIETGKTVTQSGLIMRYAYDSWGRRTKTIRVGNGVEQVVQDMVYDGSGKILSETNAVGQTIIYEYDTKGQLAAIHRPFGANATSSSYTDYDALGRVLRKTDPLGSVTAYTYDSMGRVKTRTEAEGRAEQRSVTYTYDIMGWQTAVTYQPGGQTTHYEYDSLGRRVKVYGDREYSAAYAYDANDHLVSVTDALGHTTTYGYNIYGERTGLAQGNSLVVMSFDYDKVGNQIKTTDGKGNSRATYYDPLNRPVAVSIPASSGSLNGSWWTNSSLTAQSMVYNRFGQIESTVTNTGASTSATYDELGRLQTSKDAAGLTATYSYDAVDHVVQITYSPAPGYTESTAILNAYDPYSGQLVSTTDRAGLTTRYEYNSGFQKIAETNSQGLATTFEYDGLGHLIKQTVPSVSGLPPAVTQYVYDRFDQVTDIIYPDHTAAAPRIEHHDYDHYGKLIGQSGAGTYPITYGYDAAGNRVSMIDGNNSETKWEYDAANRVSRKVYADGKDYAYTYDEAGNLKTRRDSKGFTTTYSYNAYRQLLTVDYPNDVDVSFSYDTAGRRTGMTDGSGITTWDYDSNNRITRESQSRSGATLTYSYTTEGQRASMTLAAMPASGLASPISTAYSYDNTGRLALLTDSAVSPIPFRYEWKADANLIESVKNPSGGSWTKTYDELGRLKSVSAKGSGNTVINNFTYTYDLAGQRTQEAATTGIRNYTYDEKRQLINADGGAGYQYGYNFDPIGNRLTTTNSGAVTSYLPNNVNQYSSITLPSVPQPIAPVYDANGNMTSNGKGMTLDYDEENHLKSVSSGNKHSEFVYDGLGRRVERKEYVDGSLTKAVRYVYDDKLPVQELESTDGTNFTTARHYTRVLDLSQTLQGAGGIGGLLAYTDGSGSYYYSTDGNGNVTDLVDNGGVIAAHYEYSPFGEKTVTSGSLATTNPYQWSSKEYHQESGLVYYLYRYYDANQGRWLSRDPVQESGGVNLYAYVGNEPIKRKDPSGLWGIGFGDNAGNYTNIGVGEPSLYFETSLSCHDICSELKRMESDQLSHAEYVRRPEEEKSMQEILSNQRGNFGGGDSPPLDSFEHNPIEQGYALLYFPASYLNPGTVVDNHMKAEIFRDQRYIDFLKGKAKGKGCNCCK